MFLVKINRDAIHSRFLPKLQNMSFCIPNRGLRVDVTLHRGLLFFSEMEVDLITIKTLKIFFSFLIRGGDIQPLLSRDLTFNHNNKIQKPAVGLQSQHQKMLAGFSML